MATNPLTLLNGTTAYASDVESKVNPLYTGIDSSNMTMSAAYVWTGIHTFDATKLTLKGAGAGKAAFQYANSATGRTVTVPDPGAAADFVMSEGAQTINGAKVLTDGAVYGQPLCCSRTLILPEYVQAQTDFVPLLPIEAGWAPYGILVTKFGIKIDANRAYSVVLEDWSDPATASADISTVATGAGEKEQESGALTATVAAGHIVGIDLPTTTGAKFLQAWFTYEIKAS